MAVTPPVVMPDEKILWIIGGILARIPGTSSTLIPMAKLIANTRTALPVDICRCDNAYSRCGNSTEHQQCSTTEHTVGDEREELSHHREESEQEKGSGNEVSHIAACHPCELYHSIVLREDGVRETVEDGRQERVESVGEDTALSPLS